MNLFPRHIHSIGIFPYLRFLIITFVLTMFILLRVPASTQTLYSIRVASFQDHAEAVKKLEELKKLGHQQAFIKTVNLEGKGTWHRVYIEKFSTRTEAVQEARIFQKLELISDYGIDPVQEDAETPPLRTENRQKVFFLHVHSFQEKENAEKNVEILKNEGQKAFYVQEEIRGQDWYRVYVGEFDSESSARQAGLALVDKGLISYFKAIEIELGDNRK